MTKVSFNLIEHDGRLYFNDGTGFVLVDTGFIGGSRSLDGKIGPFTASKSAPPTPFPCHTLQDFFEYFLGPVRPEGKLPKAILNPLDYGSCLIGGDSITVDDSVKELPAHDYFLPFVSSPFPIPIIEGKCDGKPMRFCFDTGARMAIIDDSCADVRKESQGTIKEWIPSPNIHRNVDVPYYPADFEFNGGFHFKGHVEIDQQGQYINVATGGGLAGFDAFFGVEICRKHTVFISNIPGKRGVAIISKDSKKMTDGTHTVAEEHIFPQQVQSYDEEKQQLLRICQDSDEARRMAVEQELLAMEIGFMVLKDGTLVVPAKCQDRRDVIALCAHYDVWPASRGYNDNGMSIVIVLGMMNALPDNVEVVFTNGEEAGMTGAQEYLESVNDAVKACVNLDVCGCFDEVYLDPMNCPEAQELSGCKKGEMPPSDARVFSHHGIPSVCFSTGKKDVDFQKGIMMICSTMHNAHNDNDLSLLNFEMIPKVQTKVRELITRINS